MNGRKLALFEAAKIYAVRGWRVLPVQGVTPDGACTCGKAACNHAGKHPQIGVVTKTRRHRKRTFVSFVSPTKPTSGLPPEKSRGFACWTSTPRMGGLGHCVTLSANSVHCQRQSPQSRAAQIASIAISISRGGNGL